MNKRIFVSGIIFLSFLAVNGYSQIAVNSVNYHRSSLAKILVEADAFPKKDTVISAYYNAPFPEKYNDHTIDLRSFNSKDYALTEEQKKALGIKNNVVGKIAKGILSRGRTDLNEATLKELPYVIDKFFKEEKVANQLVAKWFNRQDDGSFDMNLVAKRGFYDASEMEAHIAKNSVRGVASLADAGEELLNNTFVVVDKMDFINNEVSALAIQTAAYAAADEMKRPLAAIAARKAADIAYNKTKDGYSVWTSSYLYKLKWNDSIAAVFYNDYWFDENNIDTTKRNAFDSSDLFELEFIGMEKAKSLVLFTRDKQRKSKKNKKNKPDKTTEEQIIKLASIRNIDNVFTKLQKSYDVFKTKTPIYSTEPLMAKIGAKEGLEGGERFEVLEQTLDPDTGLTKYVRKGVIKADKNAIWDNRYYASEESESEELEATTFTGGGNDIYAGMLIRQIK
ncbi:hypothetical protein [uncultured Draconibacterium sp.]|uniref:hypothetical protein n=1 Tax=uncultured Draconibacterium sp. TaxID=1573823 RepID=UPI0029C9A0F4|nr:hypothetical protein [uncultured Draconibacterium sp.]